MTTGDPLLVAHHLTRRHPAPCLTDRLRGRGAVTALDDVSLQVHRAERLGVVGESGSGKTTLLRILLGLERPDAGTVTFDGRPVTAGTRMPWFRARVQLVPQDPSTSLNPYLRVGDVVAEPLRCLDLHPSREPAYGQAPGAVPGRSGREDRAARVARCLELAGLPAALASRRPGELSGGERQRVAIARALAPRPEVVLADEAVSALDATVRRRVLQMLRETCEQAGVALVLVSHDLGAVFHTCESVAVLDRGRLVESGPVEEVFTAPAHLTTRRLVSAVPRQPRTRAPR
ncbi:ABC transporter ATP-binding protein [Arsenicicoccus dermatophilus]|uniref:ABC transporter ATP-binding protein n=1 Tax=Arsenicicoccus dermatophilus TaxID=1076331 RepID=UPI00391726DD